jgi:hypothetical protein
VQEAQAPLRFSREEEALQEEALAAVARAV